MLKCTGRNVSEVTVPGQAEKVPMHTATLADPADPSKTLRIVGGAGTIVATMEYGKIYDIAEQEAQDA